MRRLRDVLPACTFALCAGLAHVASLAADLPPQVEQALQRARVPADALAVVVREVGTDRHVLSAGAQRAVNPASLTKLLTTLAALDRLGPAWTWTTPVWLHGRVQDGVLDGHLVLQGTGDPKLVVERLWLLLRRVQQLGVHTIRGDIVLDNSAFAVPEGSAADFDGEPTRPYNVQPAALLLNYKTVRYDFVPDTAAGVARVLVEPALAGVAVDRTVPLVPGPCGDWRGALKPEFGAERVRFAGAYGTACGELSWLVADPQPASYNGRLLRALWAEMGGQLGGTVREGAAPVGVPPSIELRSPPLGDLVRDINKFSNNVMAQQLFYTLDLQRHPGQPATAAGAREALRQWLSDKLGELPPDLVLDNGSGLSRDTRLTAQLLARLLVRAYDSPVMPELVASLPVLGLDGTLRRARATPGRAHLKTGSLRDVSALAGYVLADSGRRYVLVAVVQHANAQGARPALDALVQWVMQDAPPL
ncbi:D-alanyl-D-alanine carboxypeptidase/D-alanyl-D-alanine endopeptidase [Rubrivivax sp. RP6-9]|uniref:D-alanyl-D-alanine carboxypeptidase/D-alanyl-D-alanine endopeptidase n=1 Tax=Rubrivivax sp. RP6-9 TaxID=3415750 RepID=UPI003CC6AC96